MNRFTQAVFWLWVGFLLGTLCCHLDSAMGAEYRRVDTSAYCICKACCGPHARGITASGVPARGKLIAAPKSWAFGTRVHVPGWGTGVVQDRGGAIKERLHQVGWVRVGRVRIPPTLLLYDRIDLLMPTHREALRWGRRILTVRIERCD